jgi:glutathione S-transferase
MHLFDYLDSGNGFKVRLLLAQLKLTYRWTNVDIALYAYTHVAPDGGLDLTPYVAVRKWLQRVAAQPRYIELLAEPGRI